jgi:hypothetical protein
MKFPKLPKFMDKKNLSKMLENKYVLYFVFILAIINLFGYMITGNFNSIIFFVLVGFLTTFFSKNMILILTVPLVLTSVLMVGKTVKESFENADKSIDEQIKELQGEIDDMIQKGLSTDADKTAFKEKNDKLQKLLEKKASMPKPKLTSMPKSTSTEKTTPTTSMEKTTTSEPMSSMYNKPNRIDYAATVEDAYDDLNKILGGNGIKQLTDDTQKLMQQQLQLADAMKSMSPLMEQAKGLLQGFDLKNLSSLTNVSKNLQMPVDGN